MKRRKFLSRLTGAAAGASFHSPLMNGQQPPPSIDDPGSTLDILRPLSPRSLSPYDVGTRAQLFADDSLVRYLRGVSFTLHPAEKLLQPVTKADRPWEGWRLCLFGNVIYDRDEKLFKMWYLAEAGAKSRNPYFPQNEYNEIHYATSDDGIHWEKPPVGTIPASQGSKFGHNCVALVEQPNIFKDHSETNPDLRYKMITFSGDPREARGYYTIGSPDGIHWRPYSPSLIAPARDNINAFLNERRGLYIAYPKVATSIRGYSRRVYYVMASKNFRQWTTPVLSFAPGLHDDMSAVSRLERFRPILNIAANPTWLYYAGSNYAHGCPCFYNTDGSGQGTKYTASIGLAKWRLDRFVSADGPAAGGSIETSPIVHEGGRLELNAAVKPEGSLTVQVLDAGGRPIEGFPASDMVRGDSLLHIVSWNGNSDATKYRGKPVSLLFRMKQAELYSFAFRA